MMPRHSPRQEHRPIARQQTYNRPNDEQVRKGRMNGSSPRQPLMRPQSPRRKEILSRRKPSPPRRELRNDNRVDRRQLPMSDPNDRRRAGARIRRDGRNENPVRGIVNNSSRPTMQPARLERPRNERFKDGNIRGAPRPLMPAPVQAPSRDRRGSWDGPPRAKDRAAYPK